MIGPVSIRRLLIVRYNWSIPTFTKVANPPLNCLRAVQVRVIFIGPCACCFFQDSQLFRHCNPLFYCVGNEPATLARRDEFVQPIYQLDRQ